MTPMIDVVFQLIIFFMYTSQFANMTRTQVDLPEQPGLADIATDPSAMVVDIHSDGTMFVDGQQADLDQVLRMVQKEIIKAGKDPSAVDLLIRADRSGMAQRMNELATGLADLGVRSWKLATTDIATGASEGGSP